MNKLGNHIGNARGNALQGFNYISTNFLTESENLFRAMDVTPTADRKRLINFIIKDLISNGIWQEIDVIWFTAAHHVQASKINWKNPGRFFLTHVNNPLFTIDEGVKGDAVSSYIDTNFNPAVHAINYKPDNVSAGTYIRDNIVGIKLDMGISDTVNNSHLWILSLRSGTGIQNRPNNINQNTITAGITDSRGFTATRRRESASNFKNGIEFLSGGLPSPVLPNGNVYILTFNNLSGGGFFSDRQISLAYIGSADINQKILYSIIQKYMTEIGAAV